jgi:hypothetical protein
MHPLLRTIILAAVTATIVPVSQVLAQAADPQNGTWELNLAKSKFDPGPAPKSQTRTYEAVGGAIKMSAKGVSADGKEMQINYTGTLDGKDFPVTGNPDADTISLKKVDDSTVEATLKKAGKVVSTSTRVISKDGKVMTIKTKGTNAKGEQVNNTLVFDKQ